MIKYSSIFLVSQGPFDTPTYQVWTLGPLPYPHHQPTNTQLAAKNIYIMKYNIGSCVTEIVEDQLYLGK